MKLWIVRFLITIFCFIAMATDGAFADKQQNFISLEKANEIFSKDENIRLITGKWAAYSSGITIPPSPTYPYYTYELEQKRCGDHSTYPVCEQFIIRLDAYTGKILYPDSMKTKVAAIKKSKKQMELEKPFKSRLEKIPEEMSRSYWTDKKTCQQAIQNALPLVLEALNKETPDIRMQGLIILSQLASNALLPYKTKEAIPMVIELLRDEDYSVRYEATQTLAKIGDKNDKNLIKALLPLINDIKGLVRRGAVRTLAILGDASLVTTFIPLLEESEVTQEVVIGLGRLGDARAIDPLIKLFNNKDFFYVERDIIAVLGEIGSNQAIPFLVSILNKSYTRDTKFGGSFNPHVPYMGADAARALVKIGKDATPHLLQSLKSEDWMERLYAAYALGLQKDATTLNALQEAEEKEKNITVKNYLSQAIAVINGKEYLSPLLQQLKIQVISAKGQYQQGEAIHASIVIQNTGAIPIVINSVEISLVDLAFEITGPDEKPVEYRVFKYDSRTAFPSEKTLLTLKPGESHRFGPYILDSHFVFNKSGKYKVVGVYSNPPYASGVDFGVYALVGSVKSEPVTIEVR